MPTPSSPSPGLPRQRRRWLRNTLLAILALIAASGAAFYLRPLWVANQLKRVVYLAEGVRSRHVQLGSCRVHYLVAGAGRPLVLVHGLGGSADDWGLMLPALVRHGFRVYAIDLPGYGQSDRPDVDYSIAYETDALRQFFDSQRIAQASLGGWSMGGWVALKFTLAHPERVRRVVVYDSAGIRFPLSFNPVLFHPRTSAEFRQFMRLLSPKPIHFPQFVVRDFLRQFRKDGWVVDRALASMQTGQDFLDGKLRGIHAPVLIVWGKQDALIPLWCGEEMHREMPQSILAEFNGCGHLAPVECRDRVVPETIRFLEAGPIPIPALPGGPRAACRRSAAAGSGVAQSLAFQRLCDFFARNRAYNPARVPLAPLGAVGSVFLYHLPPLTQAADASGDRVRLAWRVSSARAARNTVFCSRRGFFCRTTGTPSCTRAFR
ncbi:MAG TPA: alpha/beta fold hydrolase [Terriglobia bacterium]|nr:alpha/beta fold hydrolase [Terriglobia bacterium]